MRGQPVIAAAMKVSRSRCMSWIALLSILLRTVAVVYGEREHCDTLRRNCDISVNPNVLGSITSDNRTLPLMCTSEVGGQFVWYRNGSMMTQIVAQSNKYVFSKPNDAMLEVMNVDVSDEGVYFCRVNDMFPDEVAACILAYVPAEFSTCPGGFNRPRFGCTEVEQIDATTEDSIVRFDVSLTHKNVPSSCYNQSIGLIHFTRKGGTDQLNVSIQCGSSRCEPDPMSDPRYRADRMEGSEFNIVIELVNQTVNDSGEFSVRAELAEAGETTRFCVYKNFSLTVTVPTTQPPTTGEGSTSGSSNGSSNQTGLSTPALIAIIVVFVVLFIPLVILAIAVILLCSLTCYRRRQEAKKQGIVIYEETDQVARRNGGSLHKLLGQPDAVSQNEADGVGELNPNINSPDTSNV